MIEIPVIWHSYGDDSIARGYWDQAMLEDVFAGNLWSLPSGFRFLHRDKDEHDLAARIANYKGGAIVVLPGRHNADRVDQLNTDLAALDWVLLIITGDEECAFPAEQLTHPRRKVWYMGAKPDTPGIDRPLGSGYTPGMRDYLRDELGRDHALQSRLAWAFAGQITHTRRESLRDVFEHAEGGIFVGTEGFTQGLPQDAYWHMLACAVNAPAPSGPVSLDSFRLYEALEAGAIPWAEVHTPQGGEPDYWPFVLGGMPPFPITKVWDRMSVHQMRRTDQYGDEALQTSEWWLSWKRDLVYALHDDLSALANDPAKLVDSWRDQRTTPSAEITVVIPTSPTPTHPDCAAIDEVVASVRAQLPEAEIIIVCDGVRPELEYRTSQYRKYVAQLLWRAHHHWSNVLVLAPREWGHQANATRRALHHVETPLVLFCEHDTPIYGEIDWVALAHLIHDGTANVVRFHHEASVLPEHEHLMVGYSTWCESLDGGNSANMRRTVQWSQRPHLAPAWFYRDIIERYFGQQSRTMIEDVMHGVVDYDWRVHGMAGWERWRLWLYTPDDDDDGSIKRSWHLDTRGDDDKFPMVFDYDGPTPEGAPTATKHR